MWLQNLTLCLPKSLTDHQNWGSKSNVMIGVIEHKPGMEGFLRDLRKFLVPLLCHVSVGLTASSQTSTGGQARREEESRARE